MTAVYAASAITPAMLHKEPLVSPTVYNLPNKHDAKSAEKRFDVIRETYTTRQLVPINGETLRYEDLE